MTVEEQRYLDECSKLLNKEQLDIVTMAIDYGISLASIRQVVKSNKNAACMKEIIFSLMENVGQEVVDFLCESDFNQYQMKEIVEGLRVGLTLEQVKAYAVNDMSANRMKKMRIQLMQNHQSRMADAGGDNEVRAYIKSLMEVMESSIQQFRESNERFDTLSSLVKEHVVEEKNREIQDLYENLKYKDTKIRELQEKLSERDKQIADMEAKKAVKTRESVPAGQPQVEPPKFSESELANEEAQSLKKRMLGWLLSGKDMQKDMLEKIMAADLSAEQLEEVRKCIESGLKEKEISRGIKNSPTPDRMKKMREILLLMTQRKAGE